MVKLKSVFSRQPSAVGGRTQNWSHLIWREWRNCEDEEYARHLFDLVVDEPTDWRATAILVLLGAMFGTIGGCLITLLLHPETLNIALIALGLIACLIGGVLIILQLRLARWSWWSFWLVGLSGAISGWLLILMAPASSKTSLVAWAIVSGIAIGATGWVLIMSAIGSGQQSMWGFWLVGLIPARLIVDEAGRLTFWRATLIVNLFSAICGAISGWLLVLLLYPLYLSPALMIWGITLGVAVGVITGLLAMLAIRGGQRFLWGF